MEDKISRTRKGQLGFTGQEMAAAAVLLTGVFTIASASPGLMSPGMHGEIPSPKLQGELGNNTLNNLQKMGLKRSDLKNLSKMEGNRSKINISSGEKNASGDKPDWIKKVGNRSGTGSGSGNQTGQDQTSGNMNTTQNRSRNSSFNTSFNQSQMENLLNKTQSDGNKSGSNQTQEEKKSSDEKKNKSGEKEGSKSSSSGSGGGGATSGLSLDASSSGGPMSLSNEVVAIVEAPKLRKLKMASYDAYNGDGWERNYEMKAYSEPIIKGEGEKLVQKIYLNTTLSNLVAAWKPQSVEGIDSEMKISEGGRIKVSEPLEPGDTYTVTSRVSRPSSSELRSAGTSYTDEVVQKYTKLPDSVPSRVGEKTSEIVEGEETAYAKFKEIEKWLAENKNYSLKAPDNPSGMGLAEHFMFNTDKGYCSYFATTTVVMLRTQDIPARYVSGYGGGTRNENGNYVIRKKNAHAWIEVYFPEHGWVSFDPTAGSSPRYRKIHKSEQQQPEKKDIKDRKEDQKKQKDEKKQENRTEQQKNQTKKQNKNQTKKENDQKPEYNLKLVTENPVPGSPATVKLVKTVGQRTTSVSGAEITVEDSEVTTSEKGTASSTVPYERWFNASYQEKAELGVKLPTEIEVETEGRMPGEEANITAEISGVPVDGGSVRMNDVYRAETSQGSASVTLPWKKSVNITVSKGAASGRTSINVIDDLEVYNLTRTLPSREATFGVKIRQKPVEGAKAKFNGSTLGETSETGIFTAEMPSKPGNYTYRLSKGEASGSIKVEIENLTVDAEPRGPVALPMGKTTVRVEVGQEPAGNVTVSYSGGKVTTNKKGIAEVSNPLKNSLSFRASKFGQRDTAKVSNLLVNLILLVLSSAGIVSILSYLLYRKGIRLSDIRELWKKLKNRGTGLVVDGVILAGEKISGLLGKTSQALRHPKITYRKLRQKMDAASTLRSVNSDSKTHVGVDEAWNVLKQNTSLGNLAYHTPGEIKRHAIQEDELPEEAVKQIVDAFRGEKYAHRKLKINFSSYVRELDEGGVSS